jgi:acyl-CoA thioester hydrolase
MSDRWDRERLEVTSYPGPGLDLPVLYADLDTNRHLNNVAVGRFFEHARATTFAATGYWHAVHAEGGLSVIVRVAIDYLREGHLGDLHVRSRLTRVGTSSATVQQAAWQDGACLALAEVVFAHSRDGASAPWPEAAVSVLQSLVV